jgi:predicted RNA binding protein YcfA (HicA-like mRNA interferase family)
LKAVSGKNLCRALARKGWVLARINGSHHIFTKPGNPVTAVVPVHGNRTLPTGMQHGIMRAAGLTEADL